MGCAACGARAVGEPLTQPEYVLPYYGRALFVGGVGALALAMFLGSTVGALLERPPVSLQFWSPVAAAETAAWRLKLVALPVLAAALWVGARICASIRREPQRFTGMRVAYGGLTASALVALMIATLIGVTIPERLRQRQRGIEAAANARLRTIDRALLEYRTRYGTLPADLYDLCNNLPDPNGSIAAALAGVDPISYKPSSVQAATRPNAKSRALRGAVVRQVSTNAGLDEALDRGFTFTNYELTLPGEDDIFGKLEDRKMIDGVIVNHSKSTREVSSASLSGDTNTP